MIYYIKLLDQISLKYIEMQKPKKITDLNRERISYYCKCEERGVAEPSQPVKGAKCAGLKGYSIFGSLIDHKVNADLC